MNIWCYVQEVQLGSFSGLSNIYIFVIVVFYNVPVPLGGAMLCILSVQLLSIFLPYNATLFRFVLPVGFLIKLNE